MLLQPRPAAIRCCSSSRADSYVPSPVHGPTDHRDARVAAADSASPTLESAAPGLHLTHYTWGSGFTGSSSVDEWGRRVASRAASCGAAGSNPASTPSPLAATHLTGTQALPSSGNAILSPTMTLQRASRSAAFPQGPAQQRPPARGLYPHPFNSTPCPFASASSIFALVGQGTQPVQLVLAGDGAGEPAYSHCPDRQRQHPPLRRGRRGAVEPASQAQALFTR